MTQEGKTAATPARPTMEDVAREAGVSRSLVSLVFQDSPKVAEPSRERVLAAAERLGYRPNVLARNLASARTQTIGILLDDLHNPFFADALEAFEDAAAEAGYRTLIADGRRDANREDEAVRTFIDHRVDGVVTISPRLTDEQLATLAALVPLVSVERDCDLPTVDVVMHDERVGARLAVEHLAELGHARIAHIDGGPGAGSAVRREGYTDAMRALDLADGIDVVHGEYTEAAGREAATKLVKRGVLPTAIFCANDAMAAGVAAVLAEEGVDIPGDVSLVGYDNTMLAQLHLLSLTSVRQPLPELARASIAALNARMQDPRRAATRVLVPPALVVRRSTAAPRGHDPKRG